MSKNFNNAKIIARILTAVLALLFLFSAFNKTILIAEASEMAQSIGLTSNVYFSLGIIELIAVILFVIPRAGFVGFMLLAIYMGGAIATSLEHGINPVFPVIVEILLWITAFLRFPEIKSAIINVNSR